MNKAMHGFKKRGRTHLAGRGERKETKREATGKERKTANIGFFGEGFREEVREKPWPWPLPLP